MSPSGKPRRAPITSINVSNVLEAIVSLQDLKAEVESNPMHRLTLFLHSTFCDGGSCYRGGYDCGQSNMNWLEASEELLEELASIFPGEEQEKSARRSRKLQLDNDK